MHTIELTSEQVALLNDLVNDYREDRASRCLHARREADAAHRYGHDVTAENLEMAALAFDRQVRDASALLRALPPTED